MQNEKENKPEVNQHRFNLSNDDITHIKLQLNQMIWEYSPEEITIGQAEDLSCKILNSIIAGKYLL